MNPLQQTKYLQMYSSFIYCDVNQALHAWDEISTTRPLHKNAVIGV